MSHAAVIPGLVPATYARHMLHQEGRSWVEKNCYVDVWIELIHALGLDPMAMLPFTVAIDFEGDQWTFYKPSHDELRDLYGFDVQEMTPWRPLLEHAQEHLPEGKLISTESDAFYLPDTAATDYRRAHVKTTIIMQEIDTEAKTLGYFHNASYYSLEGEDFDRTFGIGLAPNPERLPLFAELIRKDGLVRRPAEELHAMSRALLAKHLKRRPRNNPFAPFRRRFERDLPLLQERGLAYYHAWAFATIRQAGGAFELASLYLRWLAERGAPETEAAAAAFDKIQGGCKTLILKVARVVSNKKTLDATGIFDEMETAWDQGMTALAALSDLRWGRERPQTPGSCGAL
jgi:Domain of unknown function (DUF1839)